MFRISAGCTIHQRITPTHTQTRTFTPVTHISFALGQAKHRHHTFVAVPFQIILQIDDLMQKKRNSSAFEME